MRNKVIPGLLPMQIFPSSFIQQERFISKDIHTTKCKFLPFTFKATKSTGQNYEETTAKILSGGHVHAHPGAGELCLLLLL